MTDVTVNDIGFAIITKDELLGEARDKIRIEFEQRRAVDLKALKEIHAAVKQLTTELRKQPETPYLYWPNRKEFAEKFDDQIQRTIDSVVRR